MVKTILDPTVLDKSWYESKLTQALQNRLPNQSKPGTQKDIAIIGAGMSGLVTAWVLGKAGHNVKVYEASNIPGGRIKTLRHPFTSGFYAEAGAMRIPKTHNLTLRVLQDLLKFSKACNNSEISKDRGKIEKALIPFAHSDPANKIFINDVNTTRANYKTNPRYFNFYPDLAETEKQWHAKDLFETCVMNYIDEMAIDWRQHLNVQDHKASGLFSLIGNDSSDQLKKLNKAIMDCMDRMSLRQFLGAASYTLPGQSDKLTLTDAAGSLIASIIVYDMHLSSSMAAILSDYRDLDQDEYWQIWDGMDRLPYTCPLNCCLCQT